MLNNLRYISIIICLLALVFSGCKKDEEKVFLATPGLDDPSFRYPIIQMETTEGTIFLWLYYQTPLHRDNFLKLANDDFYDGLIFHRVIDDFMIQGGDPNGDGTGGPGYKIDAEIWSQITHDYGALAAARLGDSVNPRKRSSGSQFYIVENAAGTHFLDGQYSVFGLVIQGMDIVEAIADVKTDGLDKPQVDVVMTKVEVIELTAAQLKDDYNFQIPF